MGYHTRLNDVYSIYRKHGRIGLWEKNAHYGYDAALDYTEILTLAILDNGRLLLVCLLTWLEPLLRLRFVPAETV